MGRINVLDKHIAELIAAGEVVERPSSVIKELVENSIDSGATAITVEIQDGGISMLRVTDNGCGIMREDIRNAFKRHATSKVREKEDLESIGTLGFRGEALASICAVAKVELLTRANNEDIGTHYMIEGGDEVLMEDSGCPGGTTFIVRNIFYNVPARMKFLKKNTSESTAAAAVVDKIALSHPDIAFTFIRDHRQTLTTAGDGVEKNCIYSVLGREFAVNAVPVKYELGDIRVTGYVTKPQAARASRALQNFFINGRFVKSRTAMAAVEEACKGMVMVGKFPGCVLHIEMPYELVDVNVHPAKIEVRFVNERPVFEAVYHAVRTSLIDGDTIKEFKLDPQASFDKLIDKSVVKKPFTMSQHEVNSIKNTPVVPPSKQNERQSIDVYNKLIRESLSGSGRLVLEDPQAAMRTAAPNNAFMFGGAENMSLDIEADEESVYGIKKSGEKAKIVREEEALPEPESGGKDDMSCDNASEQSFEANAESETEAAKEGSIDVPTHEEVASEDTHFEPIVDVTGDYVRFVGEAFKTYIIIERNRELVMIDKHALHERIIYEKLRREQGKKYAQYLLEPAAVTLSKPQYDGILSKKDLMYESGFEIEEFGGSTILVRSAPSFIDAFDVAATVEEMAQHILDDKSNIESEYTDWLYHNIACRSAIKGGDKSSPEELIGLYLEMGEDPNYRYCPHGRPTSIVMTKYSIEKQFGRV